VTLAEVIEIAVGLTRLPDSVPVAGFTRATVPNPAPIPPDSPMRAIPPTIPAPEQVDLYQS
jgi:hypothetical protein